MERPNLEHLVDAALAMARTIGHDEPDRAQTSDFLNEVLYRSQQDGGRDLWGCFGRRLLTRAELRDGLMARLSTHFAHVNGVEETSNLEWTSTQLEQAFDAALFEDAS